MKRAAILLTLLICTSAAAVIVYPPVKYGQQVTIYFSIFDSNSPWQFYEAAPAADDVSVRKDGGTRARATNGVTDLDHVMSLVLTATEMQAAIVTVDVNDESSPALFGSDTIIIPTFGHTNALQAFDLDDADPPVDAVALSGSTAAADHLENVYDTDYATAYNDPNGRHMVELKAASKSASLMNTGDVRGACRYVMKSGITADANDNSVWANSEDAARMLMADPPTTVAAVTDASTFTITAGSTADDYYNQAMIVVQDVSDSNRRAVRFVRDYTGGTKTIKTDEALPFLPAAADPVYIYNVRAVGRGRVSP